MKQKINITALFLILAMAAIPVLAQSTAFSYQGALSDGSQPANGNYNFEFRLYDSLSGGTQVGSSVIANGVTVTDGSFSVTLDFGSQFPGADRWIEILVLQSTSADSEDTVLGATTLSPRQKVGSAPYAIKSLNANTATNATQLGGISSTEYVVTTDPRMTDSRTPTSGSSDYIQNSTTTQTSSDFNISGTGKANILDAGLQFNIGGIRVLRRPGTANFFAGENSGRDNTSGFDNSFFGTGSGLNNTTGSQNSYVGAGAALSSSTGGENSFFGAYSGQNNSTGSANTLIGTLAGQANTTGSNLTMIGYNANVLANNLTFSTAIGAGSSVSTSNTVVLGRAADSVFIPGALSVNGNASANIFTASQFNIGLKPALSILGSNLFVGRDAGSVAILGDRNTFAGIYAGNATSFAFDNSFFGYEAGRLNDSGSRNSFFGYEAGYSNSTGENNSFFGASAGGNNTTGKRNTIIGRSAGITNVTGSDITLIGRATDVGLGDLTFATAIGAQAVVSTSNTVVLGRPADRVSMPGTATIGNQTTNYGQLNINAPTTNANLYMSGDGATERHQLWCRQYDRS